MASQGLSDAPSCVAASILKGGPGGGHLNGVRVARMRCGILCLLGSVGVVRTAWQVYFVRVHVEMTNHHELFTRDSHVVLTLVCQIVSHRRQMHTSVNLMASLDDVHPDTKMHTRKKRLSEL